MLRFHLYPLNWVADEDGPEPNRFDKSILPFDVVEGVHIERVSFKPGLFDIYRRNLGDDMIEKLEGVRYALVHRYDPHASGPNGEWVEESQYSNHSDQLVRGVMACLRLIRPMRQRALMIRGSVSDHDGSFDHVSFDAPPLSMFEVPAVQQLWMLRTRDCHALRKYAPEFLRAMRENFWRFKMAVLSHESGTFLSDDEQWKPKLMMWAAAIESLYTTNTNRGSFVAKERIKWFLGENTNIYAPGDLCEFEAQVTITIDEIMKDIYIVRNHIAHGERVPDKYTIGRRREGFNNSGWYRDVLFEAMSFVIRSSLLKILGDGLLDHFRGAAESDVFFGARGLTVNTLQPRKSKPRP